MKTRPFGTLKKPVSEIGLGCWQLGGDFGPMSDENAMSILSAAVEAGINFFDTADVYGGGRSESLIGKFLASHPDCEVQVATKYGRDASVYPDNYTESTLRKSIDDSLGRLGVDTLDCLQLHCVPLDVLKQGEVFGWLRQLKSEGVIREFGASVETIEEGLVCLEQEGLASLQVIFNIFRQRPLEALLPRAKDAGVSVIVRLPLASGLLAGKFTTETSFTDGDHRNYNCDGQAFSVGETFAGLPFANGVELAGQLRGILPDSMTMAQAAQRWIIDHDAVTTVITGASSTQQVSDNAATSALPALDVATHEKLAAFHRNEVASLVRGVQ